MFHNCLSNIEIQELNFPKMSVFKKIDVLNNV